MKELLSCFKCLLVFKLISFYKFCLVLNNKLAIHYNIYIKHLMPLFCFHYITSKLSIIELLFCVKMHGFHYKFVCLNGCDYGENRFLFLIINTSGCQTLTVAISVRIDLSYTL